MERLYSLGDFKQGYKSLKVTDSINDIPEELATNEDVLNTLRYLQLLALDKAFYSYAVLNSELANMDTDEQRLEELITMETDNWKRLRELISEIYNKEK